MKKLAIISVITLYSSITSSMPLVCQTTDTSIYCPDTNQDGAVVCILKDGVYECDSFYPQTMPPPSPYEPAPQFDSGNGEEESE